MNERGERVLIGMGSNLGDRRGAMALALRRIAELPGVRDVAVSGLYDSAAAGGPPGQERFLNAALTAVVTLDPSDLLRRLLDIERATGRVRTVKNGPRTLDLDILLVGERVIDVDGLTVPHPMMHRRSFVLVPAAEIAPDMLHPTLGRDVAALHAGLAADVRREVSLAHASDWHHAVGHTNGL